MKMRTKVCVSENTLSPSHGTLPLSSYHDNHILPQIPFLGHFCHGGQENFGLNTKEVNKINTNEVNKNIAHKFAQN